jgi:hypothetical protein
LQGERWYMTRNRLSRLHHPVGRTAEGQVTPQKWCNFGAGSLYLLKLFSESVGRQFDLPEYLSNQRTGKVSSRMVRQGSRSAVEVAVKHVAALLSHALKPQIQKHLLHCPEVNNGQSVHTDTSIC